MSLASFIGTHRIMVCKNVRNVIEYQKNCKTFKMNWNAKLKYSQDNVLHGCIDKVLNRNSH